MRSKPWRVLEHDSTRNSVLADSTNNRWTVAYAARGRPSGERRGTRSDPGPRAVRAVSAHPDIRPYAFPMPRAQMRGPHNLTVSHVVEALRAQGLTTRTVYSDAPGVLQSVDSLCVLWRELKRLVVRRSGSD